MCFQSRYLSELSEALRVNFVDAEDTRLITLYCNAPNERDTFAQTHKANVNARARRVLLYLRAGVFAFVIIFAPEHVVLCSTYLASFPSAP